MQHHGQYAAHLGPQHLRMCFRIEHSSFCLGALRDLGEFDFSAEGLELAEGDLDSSIVLGCTFAFEIRCFYFQKQKQKCNQPLYHYHAFVWRVRLFHLIRAPTSGSPGDD